MAFKMNALLEKLVTSLIVAVIILVFKEASNPGIPHYLALLAILFFLFVLLPFFFDFLKRTFRYFSKKYWPLIGILNGNIDSPVREYKCQRVSTEITSSMWHSGLLRILKDKSFKTVRSICTSGIDQSYTMIINPFGDNFPEEDTKLHTTFYKVCDYINNGGFFVCSGGAFYHHQNTKCSPATEQTFTRVVNNAQWLKDTFFFFEFGVSTTGQGIPGEMELVDVCQTEDDIKHIGGIIEKKEEKVKRFRAVMKDSSEFIPILREINNETFPVAIIRYGKGYLVHFGLSFESENSIEFNIALTTIKNIINNRFRKLGQTIGTK